MMGFSFGGMYSIAPNITGTLFGFKHFGANWGMLVFGQGSSRDVVDDDVVDDDVVDDDVVVDHCVQRLGRYRMG